MAIGRAVSAWLLLFLLFLEAVPAAGQSLPSGNGSAAVEEPVQDPFGRATPAGTVEGFITAIAARDYEQAARYLDLSSLRPSRREREGAGLARQFQAVLDREGNLLPRTEISRDPAGELTDALEPDQERVGSIARESGPLPILLRRVEQADGPPIWLFSNAMLDEALRADLSSASVPAEDWLPASFSEQEVAGAPLAHWLTIATVMLAALAGGRAAIALILLLLGVMGKRLAGVHGFLAVTALPLSLFVAVAVASWTAPMLGISIVAREALSWLTLIVGWIAVGWLLWRLVDVVAAGALARTARRGRASATAIIRMTARGAKVAIIAITILSVFDVFGFEVTTAIAALGIGGIALALGAQKTVENLFASLSIVSDRPFRVGDVCRFGQRMGTVEDVGMRSSRVRTLDRTLLTIPNSSLANSEIENFTVRDHFLFNPKLYLAGATKPEQLRGALVRIRDLFEGEERLLGRTARVRLLAPAEDRLPVEVFSYVLVTDLDQFLEIQEAFVLAILDILAEEGLELAPPLELGGASRV